MMLYSQSYLPTLDVSSELLMNRVMLVHLVVFPQARQSTSKLKPIHICQAKQSDIIQSHTVTFSVFLVESN